MIYEDLKSEIDNIRLNSEMNIKIRNLFADTIIFTPQRIINQEMKDLIVKCFAIASIPNISNRDLNYIKNELVTAGFFFERKSYQLSISNPKFNNKWFYSVGEVWKAIGASRIGDVYSVYDIKGNIVDEFIPI